MSAFPGAPSRRITARQREIMLLAAQGLSNKAIARRLTISEGTVKLHLHALYGRLGIQNRTTLAILAHSMNGHDTDDAESQALLALASSVRHAASNDAFDLYYQPVFRPAGDKLTGFEALLRLRGIDACGVSPTVFIPLAEKMGMIGRVGAWVLRSACCAAQ